MDEAGGVNAELSMSQEALGTKIKVERLDIRDNAEYNSALADPKNGLLARVKKAFAGAGTVATPIYDAKVAEIQKEIGKDFTDKRPDILNRFYPGESIQTHFPDARVTIDPQRIETPEQVLTDKQKIQKLGDYLKVFNRGRVLLGDFIKTHPEAVGGLTAAVLGALSLVAETPIPADYFGKASAAVGFGTIGYSRGRNLKEKIGLAATGMIAGSIGTDLAGNFVDKNVAGTTLGILDDLPTAAVVAGIGAKKAIELGRGLKNRIITRK